MYHATDIVDSIPIHVNTCVSLLLHLNGLLSVSSSAGCVIVSSTVSFVSVVLPLTMVVLVVTVRLTICGELISPISITGFGDGAAIASISGSGIDLYSSTAGADTTCGMLPQPLKNNIVSKNKSFIMFGGSARNRTATRSFGDSRTTTILQTRLICVACDEVYANFFGFKVLSYYTFCNFYIKLAAREYIDICFTANVHKMASDVAR